MKKIYIVIYSCYDDHEIYGVFTDKMIADKFGDLYGGYVEEWEVDTIADKIREGLNAYSIYLNFGDATVEDIFENLPTTINQCLNNAAEELPDGFRVSLFAKNKEEAVKIAKEKLYQYKQLHNLT